LCGGEVSQNHLSTLGDLASTQVNKLLEYLESESEAVELLLSVGIEEDEKGESKERFDDHQISSILLDQNGSSILIRKEN
jgi:hypothetical protein